MSTYPVTIRRCQHIKVNGIQCGSPAKRNEMHCYFHEQCRLMSRHINMKYTEHGIIQLPTLEDANSIQLGLAEVMRLLVSKQTDHPTASLLLRALRTAAANVKFTNLEPKPTHIVIDPKCVENRPLGATAWSTMEGRDDDLVENAMQKDEEKDQVKKRGVNKDAAKKDQLNEHDPVACAAAALRREQADYLQELMDGVARDPNYLDRPHKPRAASATQGSQLFSEHRDSEHRQPKNGEPATENRL